MPTLDILPKPAGASKGDEPKGKPEPKESPPDTKGETKPASPDGPKDPKQ